VNSVNLIPARRLAAKEASRRTRQWIGGATAYLVLLIGVAVVLRGPGRSDASEISARLAAVGTRIEKTEREIQATRSRILAEERLLAAGKMVGDHPDWSLLLDVLAVHRGGAIVLDSIAVIPTNADGSAQQSTALAVSPVNEAYLIRILGVGDDQGAVTAFALALQNTGVFERVNLIRSAASEATGPSRTSFTIECSLNASRRGKGRTP
jgi:Tfp pilus assembly protein PilN